MQRILIDANPVVPYLVSGKMSGISRTAIELIRTLDSMSGELPFGISLYTQNVRGVTAKGLGTSFKCHHAYLRNNEFGNAMARKLRLREILGRYDIQHITHNYEDVADPSRCVLTIHDAMFFSYPEEFLNHESSRRTVPGLARKARHIITISECSKNDIVRHMDIPESRITVIPWGIDRTFMNPHAPGPNRYCGNEPYFISVSCDIGRKNTISVIKAFAQFQQQSPKHNLILVWRKPSEEALKAISDNKIDKKVYFASNITDRELGDLYAGATASFFPSLYEGFGLPIAESMACGIPCVTCRNSSLEEVGGDAAIYTEPYDIENMASIMERFENKDFDMTSLKEASLTQASKFTWSHCATETINVYRQCLDI